MKIFTLECKSLLSQEEIFAISTDIENFHNIMPDYFKSLNILERIGAEIIVHETITFLGINHKIKTKHVIKMPNIHEVHILTGPTRGTSFIETYIPTNDGTIISINVELKFSGFMKLFTFFENYVVRKMHLTMREFVIAAEKYSLSKSHLG